MIITIKKLQADGCTFEVEPSELVSDLKKKVENRMSVPVEKQTLVFGGKPLSSDSQTLGSYGIGDGARLHLVSRKKAPEKPAAAQSSEGEVFILLRQQLRKHLTEDQAQRVCLEFRKNVKQLTDSMNLEDIQRFVDSGYTQF